ncbi:MAG: hypothetical protein QOF58_6644 [Pseudonocardiales bacterium]|jgi:8-oxo-dGTP pyrophosphatase MutT (NUDIX family)|nr:hypothetical protein [Actinomycetota bacterium]MDT7788225.1 hypothetical protein [Pseudonocardiales bacterium]HEV7826497.1 hypothetical protein [Mycobacteriales bacterium]
MRARRYTVRLYWRSSREAEEETNLDPRSRAALRATLERMVETHHGTLDLDLAQYSIVVHSRGGGRVHARCRVGVNGVTEVEL